VAPAALGGWGKLEGKASLFLRAGMTDLRIDVDEGGREVPAVDVVRREAAAEPGRELPLDVPVPRTRSGEGVSLGRERGIVEMDGLTNVDELRSPKDFIFRSGLATPPATGVAASAGPFPLAFFSVEDAAENDPGCLRPVDRAAAGEGSDDRPPVGARMREVCDLARCRATPVEASSSGATAATVGFAGSREVTDEATELREDCIVFDGAELKDPLREDVGVLEPTVPIGAADEEETGVSCATESTSSSVVAR